jgi:hypothetical protein
MSNIENILKQRFELEARIRELGGSIPGKLAWDDGLSPSVRNNQLLELVEDLEAEAVAKRAAELAREVVRDNG